MNNIYDLEPLEITRPEKVLWRFNLVDSNILNSIPSKSLRKFLTHSDEVLKKNSIEFESKEISKEEYLSWLPYYTEKMNENHYDIIARPEWYETQTALGYTIKKLAFIQEKKPLVTGIVLIKKNVEASFSFKAGERVNISSLDNASIGTLIDYFFIMEAVRLGCKNIYGGSSRNASGVINKFSYLEFKLRNGYIATPREDVPQLSSVPLNEHGEVMFFGYHKDTWDLYHVHPQGTTNNFVPTIQNYYSKEIVDITY